MAAIGIYSMFNFSACEGHRLLKSVAIPIFVMPRVPIKVLIMIAVTFLSSWISKWPPIQNMFAVIILECVSAFYINLTWDAVKGCVVSMCLRDLSEQPLGGQP